MDDTTEITCESIKSRSGEFNLLTHQKLVRDYLNLYTPYRGLFLFFSLGAGKCHSKGSPIMLSSGEIKLVEDIQVGDLLMGDDSTPRKVLSLATGRDKMYEVIPVKGDKYTVNSEHILCLKASGFPKIEYINYKTNTHYNIQWIEDNKFKSKCFSFNQNTLDNIRIEAEKFFNELKNNKKTNDNIYEIAIKDYLKLPEYKKNQFKGYKVPINFPEKELPFDPYMIGYWLGDGSKRGSVISSQDSTVLHYFHKNLPKYNLSLFYESKYGYNISGNGKYGNNQLLNTLKEFDMINNKHIPLIYKCNSRVNRLKLLAGLIDSDGNLSNNIFEFTQKNEKLMDDVIYLARSLGFACYKHEKKTSWTYKGIKKYGVAFRISISGSGIEEIPTLIPRKKTLPRKQIKDVLVTGITVQYIREDDYYGFTLDGNCRYLMGDFTVTHNTCSSIAIAEGMKSTKKIIIMLPASLETNYIDELKKCGDVLYKTNQCWEWVDTKKSPELIETLSSVLNLPVEYIEKQGGAWLININKNSRNCKKMSEKEKETMRKVMKKGTKKNDTKIINGTKKNRAIAIAVDNDEIEQESNDENLSDEDKQLKTQSLNAQINAMIETKYQFIHYNGIRRDNLKKMTDNFETNIFDNSVVIIDEVHNFVSRIVNKLSKQKQKKDEKSTDEKRDSDKISLYPEMVLILYDMLMRAKNIRIVLLTGTPIINFPNEIAVLFNILRGYIKTWEFTLDSKTPSSINNESLQEIFKKAKVLDYLHYSTTSKKLFITRNPFGFENKEKRDIYQGVYNESKSRTNDKGQIILEERGTISDIDFERTIFKLLKLNNIDIVPGKVPIHLYKLLPDKLDEFSAWFIEQGSLTLKNKNVLKRRIIGLTSYYRSSQEKLLAKYEKSEDFHIIKIPMSDAQFVIYESARVQERKQEKNNSKNKGKGKTSENGVFKEPSSTYRIFSRLFCNFVMPLEIGRPLPKESKPIDESKGEDVDELDSVGNLYKDVMENVDRIEKDHEAESEVDAELEGDEVIEKMADATYDRRLKKAMTELKLNGDRYLSPEGLQIYSPKYLQILENITDPNNIGLNLIYSQFRTLEGIGILKLVLEQNGFVEFKIKKDPNGVWEIDIPEEKMGLPRFALYTGTESTEEKKVILNIYNGTWDNNVIPHSISAELKKMAQNNNMGEIIKILMITASGSEGISLFNTRYVHIIEPYWNGIRTQQVVGRALRICSHSGLPLELQTVEVFIYLMTFSQEQLAGDLAIELKLNDKSKKKYQINPNNPDLVQIPFTSDEALFEISNIKEELSEQLIKTIKESSIDCSIYSRVGGKEQLQCVQFSNPLSSSYSFNPDIYMDVPDNFLNQEEIVWEAREITLNKKKYAYRPDNPNDLHNSRKVLNGLLYDLDSYMRARQTEGVLPVLLGTVKENKTGQITLGLKP